jgi:hypothetical protein
MEQYTIMMLGLFALIAVMIMSLTGSWPWQKK